MALRKTLLFFVFLIVSRVLVVVEAEDNGISAQVNGLDIGGKDDDDLRRDDDEEPGPPPAYDKCNGIFLSYTFVSREKELPHVKNVTAQSWSFKSVATILNAGTEELKAWKMFIGFQHKEILVSATGAVNMGGEDFPAEVGNGTYLSGYPQSDLKTAIETAGDMSQIQVQVELTGTMFGVKPPTVPMPKTIRLENDGYKCPAPTKLRAAMHVCCVKNPKFKANSTKVKFLPRQHGDLSIVYDVLQAYTGSYLAQVTIDNNHPLGRLDHWNLTWEWMRGEFIYTMRGAYTHLKDPSECLYGPQGTYYKDLDFSQVMNCQRKPTISDLPSEKKDDEMIGKLPYCCRNGTILPTTLDPSKARSMFQLQVYKVPPDMNRTAINPPQRWKIDGVLNPQYKCGPPIRVAPTEFPDPSGLQAKSLAMASWQVTCNITKPKAKSARCCVSFSAFYNDSVVPCNTCACGCPDTDHCNPNGQAMLLPSEALLVPFANREEKAKAWAKLKHKPVPKRLPCGDNCGVSINWHINSDFRKGWSARMTLFNWQDFPFEDWFTAIQFKKGFIGYENVYSFNGTKLPTNNTLVFHGLPFLNYLMGETNGTHPDSDPRVPGKQQSVISFKKTDKHFSIGKGDGFPTKVFFNGEECSLPTHIPTGAGDRYRISIVSIVVLTITTFMLAMDPFH